MANRDTRLGNGKRAAGRIEGRDSDAEASLTDAVVAAARAWIGTPYHHQASLKGVGADCLGLVRGVWRDVYGGDAERPPGYSRDWGEASGTETLIEAAARHMIARNGSEPLPGDVLIFRMRAGTIAKHAAILATSATMIHAMEGRHAAEVSYGAWWQRRLAAVFSFPGHMA
jgi:NlpC/P60 family putative phage cell wall peptidase